MVVVAALALQWPILLRFVLRWCSVITVPLSVLCRVLWLFLPCSGALFSPVNFSTRL